MMRVPRPMLLPLLIILSVAGCSSPEEKAAAYIRRGNELFQQGKLEKSRLEFRNASRLKPVDAAPYYWLGMVDDSDGKFQKAFGNFTKAEQQDSHFHPALIKLAQYYIAAGQVDDAEKRLAVVLSDTPEDAEAHALRAQGLLRQKKYDDAEIEARHALKIDEKNVQAFADIASIYEDRNDPAKAIAVTAQGISLNPQDQRLLRMQVALYEQQGNLQDTAHAYQALFEAAPAEKQYRVQLADDYIKAGQLDEAENVLRGGVAAAGSDWSMKHELVLFLADHRAMATAEQEIRLYMQQAPQQSDPVVWLADLYIKHDMPDKAAAMLDAVIAQNGGDRLLFDAMTVRARIDYIDGNKDAAIQRIGQVLPKDPNNAEAKLLKARIEADRGSDSQAIADLRDLLRDQPKAAEAYSLLSQILLRQGHTDLAIEALNQSVDSDPHNANKRARLAQLYAVNGNAKHAMALLFLATKEDPDYSVNWETIARLALDEKEWKTADDAIEALSKIKNQQITADLLRGQMLDMQGHTKEAIALYTKIIDANPAAPQAEHALVFLMQAYQRQNQTIQAMHYLESLAPTTPLIDTLLGRCYVSMGYNKAAAAAFDKAIDAHAGMQDPYLDRAALYEHTGDPRMALDVLEQAAAVNDSDGRAPFAEAQILERTGSYSGAIALYMQILAKQPDNDFAANNVAELIADRAYTDKDLLTKAQKIAEQASAHNPLMLDTLGWVYFRQRRLEDALTTLQRAVAAAENVPMPPQFHYHYGAVLAALDRRAEAQAELQRAVAPTADFPGIADATSLYKTVSGAP
jgi:tetratricopeptide (TPR) repeat protein